MAPFNVTLEEKRFKIDKKWFRMGSYVVVYDAWGNVAAEGNIVKIDSEADMIILKEYFLWMKITIMIDGLRQGILTLAQPKEGPNDQEWCKTHISTYLYYEEMEII